MSEQTQAVYMRLKSATMAAVKAIAEEEDRSAAKMTNILLDLGVAAYRARQKRKRKPDR